MVENVMEKSRLVNPLRSNLAFAVIMSYFLSVSTAFLIVYFFKDVFGLPQEIASNGQINHYWRLAVGLALFCSFLLALFLPIIFAKDRRLLAISITMTLQFITLIALVILGLSQVQIIS